MDVTNNEVAPVANVKEEIKEKVKKPKKSFKEYYQNEEFKARHLKKIKEKVMCKACGCLVRRCNMSHHRQTAKHQKNVDSHDRDISQYGKDELRALIKKLELLI